MTEFYSHASRDAQGRKYGSKLLRVHTEGVTRNAMRQYFGAHKFSVAVAEDLFKLLVDICLYHDLGKYTTFFQDYLLDKPHDKVLKQHARFGAQAILQQYGGLDKKAFMAYFIIKNHHRSLHNPDKCEDDKLLGTESRDEVERVFKEQLKSVSPYLHQIESELELSNLLNHLVLPPERELRLFLKRWIEKQPNVENYFFINYLFSLLIEGDKLDASGTDIYQRVDIPVSIVGNFISGRASVDNVQNRLRNEVRAEVMANLSRADILSHHIFMLTAPTGIGKTLTAIDFAIQLRGKLSHKPQIIVGLPFINIIEQTLSVYQDVLGDTGAKILAHYQYADLFGDSEADNVAEEETDYSRKRMELDTWQADIVITSFVQLLQTMISHRNKTLLKFNHLAGAIIIMDEVQSLRLEQTPLIGAVLFELSKFLGTRFILMTATKPLIFELADKVLLHKSGENSMGGVKNLLQNPAHYFKQFSRTKIVPILKESEKLETAEDFVALFLEKWTPQRSCLIVCNKVNRSIELFEALSEQGLDNTIYYLSTNVLPVQRMSVIEHIRMDLKNGEKPILVSTQVVEAGVDLDFDMGFRDLGPIDSIVQVAGRINRENTPDRAYSPLYVVDFGDCKRIYGLITEAQAKKALAKEEILEPDYFGLVEDYFLNLSDKSAYTYSRQLYKGIEHLQYTQGSVEDTIPVSKFRVIEESPGTTSVFVEWDEAATRAREAYLDMINAPNRDAGFKLKEIYEKKYKRDFHQRIIAIPKYYTDGLPPFDAKRPEMPIKWVSSDLIKDWYLDPIGFNRKQSKLEQQNINQSISL